MKTLRVKSVNGDTSFQNVILKVHSIDFIPIVELDLEQIGKMNDKKTWKYKGFNIKELKNEESIQLSEFIDTSKINHKLYGIQFNDGIEEIIVRFYVSKGNKYSKDKDGYIYIKTNGVEVKTKFPIEVRYGQYIALRISKKGIKDNAYIDFYASDNGGVFDIQGKIDIFCGRVIINPTCQPPLVEEVLSNLELTDEQKAKFIATVLVESDNGKEELWDIAYIYHNLVVNLGFERGLNRSSAYKNKYYLYKAHLYNLGYGKEYSNDKGDRVWSKNSIRDYAKKHFSNSEIVKKFQIFCEQKIFTKLPKSKYKNWEGQGYWRDMNIVDGRYDRIWEKARQYFWLQKDCQVDKILVVELVCRDKTTFLYDTKSIIEYFDRYPSKLPPTNEIKLFYYTK